MKTRRPPEQTRKIRAIKKRLAKARTSQEKTDLLRELQEVISR